MIYFDAGATTLEKPPEVYRAVSEAMRTMTSPGRGGHRATQLAEETVFHCRVEAAELFGVSKPENVVFTFNATHGLNIAIASLIRPGSRVIISGYEHNAVVRPLFSLPDVEVVVIDTPLFRPDLAEMEFRAALRRGADAVICCHVSNVFGYALPVEKIAAMCREMSVPLIVDASQSAGILPIRMDEWGAAFIAMPGHKGLYGPQGTGILLCSDAPTRPVLCGGTGNLSRHKQMPEDLPERLEAGTHNVPGIAGLLCGIKYVKGNGLTNIRHHHEELTNEITANLHRIPGIFVYTSERREGQTGVISFTVKGRDCQEMGELLGRRGIAVRAGLHCAPLAHRTAGTLETGTVRISISSFNDRQQAQKLVHTVGDIVGEMAKK